MDSIRWPGPSSCLVWLTWVVFAFPTGARGASAPNGPQGDGRSERAPAPSAEPKAPPQTPAGASGRELVVETLAGTRRVPLEGVRLVADRAGSGTAPRLRLGDRSVSLDEVLFLRLPAAFVDPADLELVFVNGDRISGTVIQGGADQLEANCPASAQTPLTVQLTQLKAIRIRPSRASEVSSRWKDKDLLSRRSTSDVLYLKRGGSLEGVLESIDRDGVRFSSEKLGSDPLLFAFEKIWALRLAELEGKPGSDAKAAARPELSVVVYLADGGLLTGVLEEFHSGGTTLRHDLLGTIRLNTPWISELAVRGGRCEYLSDLKPSRTREHMGPLFGPRGKAESTHFPFRRDTNCVGDPIRLGGNTYRKGLGVHSYSLLEYRLDGDYERFRASIGLDSSARPAPGNPFARGGEVVFRVYLDGKKVAEEAMTYRDAPRKLDLALAGVKLLGLEVDFGSSDFACDQDRANWADARVMK